ncbi:glycosyltransferase [Kaistia algarum]|uniref:glycosyltransferase n=1 Tax=Kaistia algarum TaxID=2083279 RepID=UPI001402F3F3|nr:glycosyltransferase [Kaistia algarum]MCX5515492.1 glycosyltransferase [Kaistia algarum]
MAAAERNHLESGIERSADTDLTIIICTYRRPQIVDTLESLIEQDLPAGLCPRFLIVDNDEIPSAEATVRLFFTDHDRVPYRYVHAPKQDICIARNAGLTYCETRWALMIDDDERATSGCIKQIWEARGSRQAVFGRTEALYDEKAPRWMREADLHSNKIIPGRVLDKGHTSIALVDVDFVRLHGLHFEPRLGQVGGEDMTFFNDMFFAGGELGYAPEAVVTEVVPPGRSRLSWVIKRRFRAGQVACWMAQRRQSQRERLVAGLRSTAIFGVSIVSAAGWLIVSPARSAQWLARATEHLGRLAHAAGVPLYREYG